MQKIPLVSYITAIFSCFFGCSDDSTDPQLQDTGSCRIQAISIGTTKLHFIYNKESRIDSMKTYDGKELVYYAFVDYIDERTFDVYHSRTNLLDDSILPHDLPERLEFDAQGRLVKYSFIENKVGWPPKEVAPYISDFDTLIYNERENLIEVQYWIKKEDVGDEFILSSRSSFIIDANRNATSLKYMDLERDEEENYIYTYDDKKRLTDDPLLLAMIYYNFGIFAESTYFSQNNVLTDVEDNGETDIYSYTYNGNGRPESIKKSGLTMHITYDQCN